MSVHWCPEYAKRFVWCACCKKSGTCPLEMRRRLSGCYEWSEKKEDAK